MRRIISILVLVWIIVFFGCMLTGIAGQGAGNQFKIVNRFALSGGGRWDYLTVDTQTRRLYMSRTSHVSVFDADTGAVVGDIPDTPGVHGITLVPDLGVGFISNGGEDKVTVFDLKTLKALTKIATGGNPDSILYHPATRSIFVQNGKDNSSTVIDANSKKVVATIPYGARPEFAVFNDRGNIFINLEDKNSIAVVNAAKRAVTATWPLAGCEGPTGLAIDGKTHTLFAACGANAKLAVVDSESGKLIQLVPIGEDCDAVAFDSATGHVYASTGDGNLDIIHKDASGKYVVVQNLPLQPGSKTMCLDPEKHTVYVPAAKFTGDPTKRPRPSVVDGSVVMLVVGK